MEFYDGTTLKATDTATPYTYLWSFTSADNGTHQWTAKAYDAANNVGTSSVLALTVNIGGSTSTRSINSTSQSCGQSGQPGCGSGDVSQQPAPTSNNSSNPASGTGLTGYQIVAVNDLGMHCGDLDTRIVSILPPFNVLNVRVLQKPTHSGGAAVPLDPRDVDVYYSAASNSADPVFGTSNPPGFSAPAGSVYKTNFWDTARTAYDPFYPALLLPLFYPQPSLNIPNIADVGLAVPNLEEYYLTTPTSTVLDQQGMPAITTFTTSATASPPNQPTAIASSPYMTNQPQKIKLYVNNWPFFSANFGNSFGYVASNLNWFTAEGIPIATYDDAGRLNSYPLMRVQAKAAVGNALGLAAGTMLATVDTVLPVSAEADCKGCHADPFDSNFPSTGNSTVATNIANKLGPTYLAYPGPGTGPYVDPKFGAVPLAVSIEWAADKNILRLHDYNEGTKYPTACDLKTIPNTTNTNCLVNKTPVVCQTCHYTPALDLLQVGPGPASGGGGGDVNGRQQTNNQSMSRVMHNFHGLRNAAGTAVSTSSTDLLFPYMPASNNRTTALKESILTATCYQCHPGKNTKCMRGAMANASLVCQDCHGQMTQVGNDFSKNMPGGSFILASDFYTNANTPRVPWANEPGCGSCHTGDVKSNCAKNPSTCSTNLTGTLSVIANTTTIAGYADGIRLKQAYLTTAACTTQAPGSCPKVTPIVHSFQGAQKQHCKSSTCACSQRLKLSHGRTYARGVNGLQELTLKALPRSCRPTSASRRISSIRTHLSAPRREPIRSSIG